MGLFTLAGERPALTAAMTQLEQLAAAVGIAFATADYGGVRTEADTVTILRYRDDDYAVAQRQAAASGTVLPPIAQWRPIAPFGSSYHNYGAARDVRPVRWPQGMTESGALARLGAIVATHPELGLRWGGTFPQGKKDPAHFELAITLADARTQWEAANKTANTALASGGAAVAVLIIGAVLFGIARYRGLS